MRHLIRPYDLILDGESGWHALEGRGISVEEGKLRLRPLEQLRPALTEPNGSFGGHALARGVAIWHDVIFVADPRRRRILYWRPCCGPAEPVPTLGGQRFGGGRGTSEGRPGPRDLKSPRGLAISHREDLVVADTGARLVLLFTLPGLALRRVFGPYGVPPWRPIDVAAGPEGTLYVADARGRIWRLDSQGRSDARYDGQLPPDTAPRRLAVDGEHRVYVIVRDGEDVLMLDRYGRLMPTLTDLRRRAFRPLVEEWLLQHRLGAPRGQTAPPATFAEEAEARAALLPAELSARMDAWLLRRRPGIERPDVWESTEGEAVAVRDEAYTSLLPEAYAAELPAFLREVLPASRLSLQDDRVLLAPAEPPPCGEKGGQSRLETDMRVDSTGHLALGPEQNLKPYLLHRPPGATFEREGMFRTEPLDSGRVRNPWHRVVIEQSIPPRTSARLFSFTTDVLRPDLHGRELPDSPLRLGWQAGVENAEEWLIQSPPGRYLYLALALKGPGDETPSIERIYVYARRESSLRYLPALFQEDETSRHLLDRLLSLFDTLFGEIESAIEDLPRALDPDATPAAFLPWLASWFDLALEQSWDDAQRRAFLKQIVTLYRWRGTRRGLRLLLQLHARLSEPMPGIVEQHREAAGAGPRRWLGEAPEGDAAHHFVVLLPAHTIDTPEKRGTIRRLIDAYKPAHAHYTLRPIHPGIVLGSDSASGPVLDGTALLGRWRLPSTGETEPAAEASPATRVGCGSALGLDSLLGSPEAWRLPTDRERDGILGARTWLPGASGPRSVVGRLGVTRLGQTRLR